jgi:hypothetical protein
LHETRGLASEAVSGDAGRLLRPSGGVDDFLVLVSSSGVVAGFLAAGFLAAGFFAAA